MQRTLNALVLPAGRGAVGDAAGHTGGPGRCADENSAALAARNVQSAVPPACSGRGADKIQRQRRIARTRREVERGRVSDPTVPTGVRKELFLLRREVVNIRQPGGAGSTLLRVRVLGQREGGKNPDHDHHNQQLDQREAAPPQKQWAARMTAYG